jgi:hypothetical protein
MAWFIPYVREILENICTYSPHTCTIADIEVAILFFSGASGLGYVPFKYLAGCRALYPNYV